jgi:RNA polymerase sigma factor (sigma-70 family)
VRDVTATGQIGATDEAVQAEQAWVPPTWEEIVEQHSARVYRLAYRLTGNVHDAEDLTHDVFIRVFRSLHSYQPGTFEGWLHRITTNLFLDVRGAGRRSASMVWARVRPNAYRAPGRIRPNNWPMPTWTTTWRPRSQPCRRNSAPPSCCVTLRASATKRSARFLTSRSELFEAGSTAAERNCVLPSRIADQPESGCDTSGWR